MHGKSNFRFIGRKNKAHKTYRTLVAKCAEVLDYLVCGPFYPVGYAVLTDNKLFQKQFIKVTLINIQTIRAMKVRLLNISVFPPVRECIPEEIAESLTVYSEFLGDFIHRAFLINH